MSRKNELSMSARLERLVDGELSPEQYRAVLASLEEEPGGWRQCGLAFLEAQALGLELDDIRRSLDVRESGSATGGIVRWNATAWEKARMLVAVAASFLIAFGLGLAAPRILQLGQENHGGGNMYAESPVVTDGRDGEDVRPLGVRYVGDVRLLLDGAADGAQEAGHVPVYEVGQDVTRYLAGEAPALGPDMLELLKQSGYEVRHDQQYFPAPLDDGRQIIVPVEGYQITPVSRKY